VVAGVEPLGYVRDGRQFKPRLAVATITDATTVEPSSRCSPPSTPSTSPPGR
jgi:hypothetical protein